MQTKPILLSAALFVVTLNIYAQGSVTTPTMGTQPLFDWSSNPNEKQQGNSNQAKQQPTYAQGWQEGYPAGYCYGDQYCATPLAPMCPMPEMGASSYKDGYNRGFLQGIKDKKK